MTPKWEQQNQTTERGKEKKKQKHKEATKTTTYLDESMNTKLAQSGEQGRKASK